MPNTIRSPVDTILGEAVYGSPTERFADMLGIASVISNRATLGNVSPQDIVSAPGQFDAYGKSFPAGTEQYRGLAEQAWNQVQTVGPVTAATYYSTPSAAKNLPAGLEAVDQTTGHVYRVDPLNRSFRTAKGFVQPAADLVASVAQKASQTARGIASGTIGAVGNTIEAAGNATATAGRGLAALAPNGLTTQSKVGAYNRAGLDPSLSPAMDAIAANPDFAGVGVNSGYRDPARNARAGGARRSQHMQGKALDLDISGLSPAQRTSLLDTAIEQGRAKGIGLYSSGNTMHIDTRANPAVWSDSYRGIDVSQAPGWAQDSLRGMMGAGPYDVTPRTTAPTPFSRDQPNPNSLRSGNVNATTPAEGYGQAARSMQEASVRGIGTLGNQTYGAPVGRVDRAALGPAAPGPSGIIDNMKAGMESPMYGAGQVAPAGVPSAPSPMRPDNLAAAGPKGNFSVPDAAPKGPTPADLAAAYGQMGATMQQAGVTGLAGTPAAAPSLAQVAQAALPGPSLPAAPVQKQQTIAAPQKRAQPQQTVQTPTVGPFPEAPKLQAPKKGALAKRAAAAAIGGLIGGLPGAAIGGLLGPAAMKSMQSNPFSGLSGLFGGTPNPTRGNYGSGLAAMSDILGGGGTAGATAYSRSTPGYSVTNLGNGFIEKTNQYGVKSYEHTGFTGSLFGDGGLFGGGGGSGGGGRGLSPAASRDIDAGRGGLF